MPLSVYVTPLEGVGFGPFLQRSPKVVCTALAIFRMNNLWVRLVQKLLLRVAKHLTVRAVHPQVAPVKADQGNANRGILKGAAEPLLAFAQRLLGLLTLGYVVDHATDGFLLAVRDYGR